MTERESLLRAILENPADDLPRLVYADWLEEYGSEDDRQRAEFIRVQVRRQKAVVRSRPFRRWFAPLPWSDGPVSLSLGRAGVLARPRVGATGLRDDTPLTRATRGFVSEIELPLADFLTHAEDLFSAHPITRVRLTDRAPLHWSGALRAVHGWSGGGGLQCYFLPVELLWHLPWGDAENSDHSHGYKGWPTTQAAHDALSVACVTYGRNLAGLPPLP